MILKCKLDKTHCIEKYKHGRTSNKSGKIGKMKKS